MATQEQINKPHRHKQFYLIRVILLIIGLLLLIAGAILWFLSSTRTIDPDWSNVLTIIFGVTGVILTFVFWLFPFPTNQLEADPFEPTSSPSNAQQLTLQQAQQAQQIRNVQNLQQFFLSQSLPASQQSNFIEEASHPDHTVSVDSANKTDQVDSIIAKLEAKKEESESLPDPDAIFHFNAPLADIAEFYGRVSIRTTLISRTRKSASSSIVGPRRIGKTWLINYLRLVIAQNPGLNFRLGYLDATAPSCATVSGFTSSAIEALGNAGIESASLGLEMLEKVVKNLRLRNIFPVLCIDEFEGLCNPHFGFSFFTELRAIEQAGLVLILASKQPVNTLVSDQVKSSPFFNIFETLILQPFDFEEAQRFIKIKGTQAKFTEQEKKYVLEYGQKDGQFWPPLRLQLAGKMLLEDKNTSVSSDPRYYRPNNLDYWRDFEKRLEGKYQGVIGK